jgi:tRNA nucleotidyltransferase (CCA-adding enzyme)
MSPPDRRINPPFDRELLGRALGLPGIDALLGAVGAPDGPRVALVGGAVRDLLLGRSPGADLDVVVEEPIDELLARLPWPVRSHGRFGTATVQVGGVSIDLARSRREHYPAPGALPEVAPAPLEADIARRDFTVNAIAVVLTGDRAGEMVSVPCAFEDLASGQLRVLHAGSFVDDPTRLMRLARYAARLNFTVQQESLRLALAAVGSGAVATVSGARIGNELRLLAAEPSAREGFAWLARLGLDGAIAPGFGLVDRELAERALRLLPEDGRPDLVLLAVAFAGVPRDRVSDLLDALDFPAAERDTLLLILRRAEKLSARLEMAGPLSEVDATVRWFSRGAAGTLELVAIAGAIHPAGVAREWLAELRHQVLSITGDDLVAVGVAPGPGIGAGLAAARAAMLDGEAEDREEQLRVAVEAAKAAGPSA